MIKKAPTEEEIIQRIRSYKVTPKQHLLIAKGLSEKGVDGKEFKGMKKEMGFKYNFRDLVIEDRFGNQWVEVDVGGDRKLGGKWRIVRKDHLAPQIERFLKEKGRLPAHVKRIKEIE